MEECRSVERWTYTRGASSIAAARSGIRLTTQRTTSGRFAPIQLIARTASRVRSPTPFHRRNVSFIRSYSATTRCANATGSASIDRSVRDCRSSDAGIAMRLLAA